MESGERIPCETKPHTKYMRVDIPLYSWQNQSKHLNKDVPSYITFLCRLLICLCYVVQCETSVLISIHVLTLITEISDKHKIQTPLNNDQVHMG